MMMSDKASMTSYDKSCEVVKTKYSQHEFKQCCMVCTEKLEKKKYSLRDLFIRINPPPALELEEKEYPVDQPTRGHPIIRIPPEQAHPLEEKKRWSNFHPWVEADAKQGHPSTSADNAEPCWDVSHIGSQQSKRQPSKQSDKLSNKPSDRGSSTSGPDTLELSTKLKSVVCYAYQEGQATWVQEHGSSCQVSQWWCEYPSQHCQGRPEA